MKVLFIAAFLIVLTGMTSSVGLSDGATTSTSATSLIAPVDPAKQDCADTVKTQSAAYYKALAVCSCAGGDCSSTSDADQQTVQKAGDPNHANLGGLNQCAKCSTKTNASKTDDDDDDDGDASNLTPCQQKSAQKIYDAIENRKDKLQDKVNKTNDGIADVEKEIASAQQKENDAEKSLKDQINRATNEAQAALLEAQKANANIDKQLSSQLTSAQEAMNKTKQDAQSKIVAAMAAEKKYSDTIRQLQLQCEAKVKDALKQNGEYAYVNMNVLSQSAAGGGAVQQTCKTNRAAVYGARDAEEQKQQDLKQIQNELSADSYQMNTIIQRMQDDTNAAATDKKTALRQATVDVQKAQKDVQTSNQALQQQQQSFQTQMQALQAQLAAKQLAAKQAFLEAQNDQTTKANLEKQGITDDGGSDSDSVKAANDEDDAIKAGQAAARFFSDPNQINGCCKTPGVTCPTVTGMSPPAAVGAPSSLHQRGTSK